MLKDITIGQHFPGHSVLHRCDPRLKLVATIAYIIVLFIAPNPLGLALSILLLAALMLAVSLTACAATQPYYDGYSNVSTTRNGYVNGTNGYGGMYNGTNYNPGYNGAGYSQSGTATGRTVTGSTSGTAMR